MAVLKSSGFVFSILAAAIYGAVAGDAFAQAPDSSVRFAQNTQQPAAGAAQSATGGNESVETEADETLAVFDDAFMNDPTHIAVGEEVWVTCGGCHGSRAYPGKGPKLKPKRYTPDFVYDRVTHGFKKMPAWKDVFSKEERMAVTAYVLSKDFAP